MMPQQQRTAASKPLVAIQVVYMGVMHSPTGTRATQMRRFGPAWQSGSRSPTMAVRFTPCSLDKHQPSCNSLFLKDYFEFSDIGMKNAFVNFRIV
jgi:hypothetical protein